MPTPSRPGVQRASSRSRSLNAALLLACVSLWQACTFPDFHADSAALTAGAPTMSGGSSSAGTGGDSTNSGSSSGGTAGGGTGGTGTDAGAAGETGDAGTGGAGGASGTGGAGGTAGGSGTAGTGGAGEGGEGGGGGIEPGALAGRYRLLATHSSKCLDAGGALTNEGNVSLQQHACVAGRPQAFTLMETPGGFYELAIDGSSDCVDVQDQDVANKVPVIRAACSAVLSQQWLPVKQNNGSYFLVNRLSTKCLDVPAQSTDDVSLQQYECNVGGNQRWVLSPLDEEPLPVIVDDFFALQKWANAGAGEGPYETSKSRDPSSACGGARAPAASGDCHTTLIATFPSGADRAGATWLHGSWGLYPGLVVEAGAARIDFKARGAKGGEKLTVKAGGVSGNTFADTFAVAPVTIQLSTAWQQFSLDLQGQTYASGVIGGFSWRVDFSANSAPTLFYIDDIVWR